MVAVGTLEVVLIRAEGIKGDEFLGMYPEMGPGLNYIQFE